MFGKLLAGVLAATLAVTPALSDTVDFTTLPAGSLGTTASASGVTFDSTTNLVNTSDRYFASAGGSICASKGGTANCRGNFNMRFGGKVRGLTLFSAGHQAGDVATIVVYRGANVVGSTGVAWNGKIDLRTYGRVTRIKIEYAGTEDGLAFGKVNFTRATAKHKKREHRRD